MELNSLRAILEARIVLNQDFHYALILCFENEQNMHTNFVSLCLCRINKILLVRTIE